MSHPTDTTSPTINAAIESHQREQQRYARRAQERRNLIADDSPNQIFVTTDTSNINFPHRTL